MPANYFGRKNKHINGADQMGRNRKLALWLVLSLVLASAFQVAPQGSPPIFEVIVAPINVPSLCVREEMQFYAGVLGNATAINGNPVSASLYNANIEAASSSPAIASISPSSASTGGVGGGREAIFTVTGLTEGTTTLTFSYLDAPYGRQAQTYVSSVEQRTIKVRNCLYSIDTVSKWRKSDGFKPDMVATITQNVFKVEEDGSINSGLMVKNVASPTVRIGCGVGMSVTYSHATITGSQDLNTGELNITLDFDPVTATTKVRCPYNISGGNTGPGKVQVPRMTHNNISFPSGGDDKTLPQTVQTNTTDSGTIRIIITPIN